jgi:uncharacterized membrane protein
MKQTINSIRNSLGQGVKGMEPLITLFSGSYLLYLAIRKRNYPLGLAGGFLLCKAGSKVSHLRDMLGGNQESSSSHHVDVSTEMMVNCPRKDVYQAWRKFENLPLFMEHLNQVEILDEKRSNWEIALPGHMGSLSWVSEIEKDVEGKLIQWKSEKGSYLETQGEVKFLDEGEDQTKIMVKIVYKPPLGVMSETMSDLLSPLFEEMVTEDIQNFKKYIEGHEDYLKKEKILENNK